ncbi:MAG: hypothetical protein GY725_05025 [bacterium]|nr:hypothetical protein [bacterium]
MRLILVPVVALLLAFPLATADAFEVFQDPNQLGVTGSAPVEIPKTGTPTDVYLYWESAGSTPSDPNAVCDTGLGAEVCAYDVHIGGTGAVSIDSFVPTDPNVVHFISGNVLRFNGGDPILGELQTILGIPLGTMTVSATGEGTATVQGNLIVTAALATDPVATGTIVAQASPPDGDGDGEPDATDNCPTVSNALQEDADLDSVGDACDNCPVTSNPAPPGSQPAGHSTTGGQADDDCDGIGNACDTAYAAADGFHTSIDANDITKFKGAINKTIAFATDCPSDDFDPGNAGSTACELYDVDGNRSGFATAVDANDITAFKLTINQSIATIQAGATAGIQPSAGYCVLGD